MRKLHRITACLFAIVLSFVCSGCRRDPLDLTVLPEAIPQIEAMREQLNRGFIQVSLDGEPVMDQVIPVQIAEDGRFFLPEDTAAVVIHGRGYRESDGTFRMENPLRTFTAEPEDTIQIGETVLIALDSLSEAYGLETIWNTQTYTLEISNGQETVPKLPEYYDYRYAGRQSRVKDQGDVGLCWADAGTTAVETSLLPGIKEEFSPEHMCFRNSFGVREDDGGNELITLAYLTAWQGPVKEEEDPYGDLESPEGLMAGYHIQQARCTESNEIETIKQQVYRFGGVESEVYMDLESEYDTSDYYNTGYAAWCCTDQKMTTHSVVIIGWDDTFPSWKFKAGGIGKGAYICQNSWGEAFGEDGVFYVSYYDTGIGTSNVVYSAVESADNYDRIYQTDLCGWTGTIGYEDQEFAWMANVYRTEADERLEAAGFYAAAPNTTFEIFLLTEEEEIQALRDGDTSELEGLAASADLFLQAEDDADLCLDPQNHAAAVGRCAESGYYTVPFMSPIDLHAGQEYAILIRLQAPDCDMPLAIEYDDAEDTTVTIEDGEGYMSSAGYYWDSAEQEQECNMCLKAFTSIR